MSNSIIARKISLESDYEIVIFLEKLGFAKELDETLFETLMTLSAHKNKKIRYLAVKNIAKLKKTDFIEHFYNHCLNETDSDVKRECVSLLGRMKDKRCIPFLITLLRDANPEIILQSIRGLLLFKQNEAVHSELKKLETHPNEIVRDFLRKELKGRSTISTNSEPHYKSPGYLQNVVINDDVLKVFPLIDDESIHLTFTSPPYYNARDYSIYKSYQEYLSFLEKVFQETHRITKEGRFLIVNTSPIIIPRASRQHSSKRYPIPYDLHPLLVKMGWEFIDDIIWEKPEASVKNRNGGFYQYRKPLSYKPNARTESVMVYRKKTDKLLDWNIKQYPKDIVEKSLVKGDYETSNVWSIDPVYDKTHSAVFPIKLCLWILQFYSFHGDLVFDPFAGSGTLGLASIKMGREFLLTEQSEEYFKRISQRIDEYFDGTFDFVKKEYGKGFKFYHSADELKRERLK